MGSDDQVIRLRITYLFKYVTSLKFLVLWPGAVCPLILGPHAGHWLLPSVVWVRGIFRLICKPSGSNVGRNMSKKQKNCNNPRNGLLCLSPSLSCTFVHVTVMGRVQRSTFSVRKEDIPLFRERHTVPSVSCRCCPPTRYRNVTFGPMNCKSEGTGSAVVTRRRRFNYSVSVRAQKSGIYILTRRSNKVTTSMQVCSICMTYE